VWPASTSSKRAASAPSGAAEVDVFPFWSRASEEQTAAMLAGERHQAEGHDAAVRRLIDQAHADGDEVSTGATIRPRLYHDGRDQ
jgi:hypothetical protein